MTCAVTSQHAAYNVTVRTTARTAQVLWFPAFDSGLRQHYIVWLVHKQPAYRQKLHQTRSSQHHFLVVGSGIFWKGRECGGGK